MNTPGPAEALHCLETPTMSTCERDRWQSYWRTKTLKRRAIEWVRNLYFAPAFARIVRRFLPAGTVLEAGCGSGRILNRLRTHRAFGCDYTLEAARAARRHCRATVVCDIAHLPFRDNAVDLVFNQGVMEHFSPAEFDDILREFRRVSLRALIIVPSATSVFRLVNPFDDLDGHFFSCGEIAEAVGRTFHNSHGNYLPTTLGLSVAGYGERG